MFKGLILAMSLAVASEGFASRPKTVTVGELAPDLEVAAWIKGLPVSLDDGLGEKVYVIEFFATWCGPCRRQVSHLTALQKAHEGKLDIVAISPEDEATVTEFVQELGDKIGYRVAIDYQRKMFTGYMDAVGENGVPHSFVVDKEGKVVWHGHPAELESVLPTVLEAKIQ